MTATMVRTGTTVRASRQIEEDLRRMGADLSSGAGADNSVISFAGLVDFSKYLLRLVSELAQQASFPADEFERERRQLVEGLQIERTTPGFLADERLRRVSVRRASVRHGFTDRGAGRRLPTRTA